MKVKIYTRDDIQVVYKRFHENPHAVVYSIDNGLTWQSPEMDTGKWGSGLDSEENAKKIKNQLIGKELIVEKARYAGK